MLKLGIIQGRLSPPVNNHIQEFPKDSWENEFNIIDDIMLNHIEWIITSKSLEEGILNLDVSKYSNKISSVTCDNLITNKIFESYYLYVELNPICEWVLKNNISAISIPLLENSTLTNENKEIFYQLIKEYGEKYPNIDFYFELESDWDIAIELIRLSPNFYLIYDTGNITSCGFDHSEWIKNCYPYIKNVHLKDRTINPLKTVKPFTGDTNFSLIFDKLHYFGYNGLYTLQLAREEDGNEIITTKNNIKIFKNLYEKKFI